MPYQPEKFRPEHLTMKLTLPGHHNDYGSLLVVQAHSQYQRPALWTYQEDWPRQDVTRDLSPVDALHWVTLAAWQDRPSSTWQLNRSLRGDPCWDQLEFDLPD